MWHRITSIGPPCLALVTIAFSVHVARAEESALGLELTGPSEVCSLPEGMGTTDEPFPVVLAVSPEAMADPSGFETLLACAAARSLRIVARLEPPHEWQQAADPYEALSGWLADLDRFLAAVRGQVGIFQLGARPDTRFEPNSYAFLVEKVSTQIRAVDQGAMLWSGSLAAGSLDWLDRIETSRLSPYLAGLALAGHEGLEASVARLKETYPSLPVWLQADPLDAADPSGFLRLFHRARAAGVRTLFAPGGSAGPEVSFLLTMRRALPSRFIVDSEPPPAAMGGNLLYFVDPLGPERAVIRAGAEPAAIPTGADPIKDLRAIALPGGEETTARVAREPQAEGGGLLETDAVGPLLVRFVSMRGPRGETETVGVTGQSDPTAEEIIARNRAVEAAQTRELQHYQAKATLSYNYRAESLNEAIDVRSVNRFYWKDGVGEYEETDLFVNGARWRGQVPSLPFITPEKVREVPLAIRMDQSYVYELKGRERIGGAPVWVISFEPAAEEGSLYSGTVWIHAEDYTRMKIRTVQHGLKEPITSNEDEIEYGPVADAWRSWWLPVKAYRQMVFTVLGRNVAVERKVLYEDFAVNTPGFEQLREQAYASGSPILRDDETGYSYLVKDEDGLRVDKADAPRNIAFFGGIGVGSDLNVGTPFAGLNYFDFDWRGTGTQIDLAFAGPLIDLAWTNPGLGDSRWELTLEGRFTGLPDRFKASFEDGRHPRRDLRALEQRGYVTVAHPITPFQKGELQLELAYDNYAGSYETDVDLVLPPTRPVVSSTGRWRYHRSGYAVDLWLSAGHRFGWQDWGCLPDAADPNNCLATGGSVRPPEPAEADDFQRWGLAILKTWYPSSAQKLSAGAAAYSGHDLDHLSRFRIGEFRNARVRGFNSFDITFDRGVTAQLNYRFTLPRGGVSLEFGVEGAVIENDEDFTQRHHLAGGGVAASFSGPWGTLMSLRAGFGLGSSLELSSGGSSLRFITIKTFDHWPF